MPRIGAIEPLAQTMPLWAIAIVLTMLAIGSLELGAWLGGRRKGRKKQRGSQSEKSSVQSHVIGSIFGLLAFLVGLTFSVALERFDERRGWVAAEATAISTTYLRAELLDEPHRSKIRSSLREYARARVVPDDISKAALNHKLAENEVLRSRLWQETRDAVYPVRETGLALYFVEAMNDSLDSGTRRALAGRSHVPTQILDTLFLYLMVSVGLLGAHMVIDGANLRVSSILLVVLFVLAITLILDIDRPRGGSINVPQDALAELVAAMDADARREAAGQR